MAMLTSVFLRPTRGFFKFAAREGITMGAISTESSRSLAMRGVVSPAPLQGRTLKRPAQAPVASGVSGHFLRLVLPTGLSSLARGGLGVAAPDDHHLVKRSGKRARST